MAVTQGSMSQLWSSATSASTTLTFWPSISTSAMSWSSSVVGNWVTPLTLHDDEVKQLRSVLEMATADDESLRDLAGSLMESAALEFDEVFRTLKTLRALVMLANLQEKLGR